MSESFSQEIKQYFAKQFTAIKTDGRLFTKASQGQLQKQQIGLYIYNLFTILIKTAINMKSAEHCSKEQGLTELSNYYNQHLKLDSGNEQWALSDLASLEFSKKDFDSFYLTTSMSKLIALLEQLATNDPESYLGHQVTSGYVAHAIGSELINLIQVNCGISTAQVNILEKYKVVDNEYNLSDLSIIDSVVRPTSKERVFENIKMALSLFVEFQNEVADSSFN
ncbi:MAG: hypothetical protein ISR65_08260 [Bacteriovoracaceae bacterium]|nr:hypothetical protein [Bacteriovoracaceae bacterium]